MYTESKKKGGGFWYDSTNSTNSAILYVRQTTVALLSLYIEVLSMNESHCKYFDLPEHLSSSTSPKPGPGFPCHRLFYAQCVKVLEVVCTSPKPGPGFPYVIVFFVLSVLRCQRFFALLPSQDLDFHMSSSFLCSVC